MVNPSWHNNYDPSWSQAIYLYTVPLKNLKVPIDVFGHWAVCIQGNCYEIIKGEKGYKKRGEQKFHYNLVPELEWINKKGHGKAKGPVHVGYMTVPYTKETIHQVVWDKTLQGKYRLDEKNCQVFIRLLIDLIGNEETKEKLPQFFDKWMKGLAIAEGVAVIGMSAAVTGSLTMMSFGMATATVDFGATAVASAAMMAGSAGMLVKMREKTKYINHAQEEIREILRKEHGIQLV